MSRSRRKVKIFGNAGKSEKKDKRINNRMFRRIESKKNNEILKTEDLEEKELESLDLPIDMDEVRNVWAMKKDGKTYWKNASEKHMRK